MNSSLAAVGIIFRYVQEENFEISGAKIPLPVDRILNLLIQLPGGCSCPKICKQYQVLFFGRSRSREGNLCGINEPPEELMEVAWKLPNSELSLIDGLLTAAIFNASAKPSEAMLL